MIAAPHLHGGAPLLDRIGATIRRHGLPGYGEALVVGVTTTLWLVRRTRLNEAIQFGVRV